jgi:hypothetical protein
VPERNKLKFTHNTPNLQRKNVFVPRQAGFNNRHPEFSFKHYAHNHKKYSCVCINDIKDFYEMFKRLKAISGLTWFEIKNNKQFHFHEIQWDKTCLSGGRAWNK